MNKDVYTEYCTGCGLCQSICGVSFEEDEKGYNVPVLEKKHIEFCDKVCPSGGSASSEMNGKKVWGEHKTVCLGWATDAEIRQRASSGGVLTALCCYLLKQGKVDGIIQTKVSPETIYKTETVISRTCEEVLECMGSRYSVSSPLSQIKQMVKTDETYAFVGKPCDVSALRMYLKQDQELEKQIAYLFSFFCAGQPSEDAQRKLLTSLGCEDIDECKSLHYRGNGWPGYATVVKNDGTQSTMSYHDSWGKILGRDVRKSCRFCLDGIGEFADISCGDAWYMTKDGKPDFSEAEGRNIVFCRTEKGNELLEEAVNGKHIFVSDFEGFEYLQCVQKYQYERRTALESMILAMKLCGRKVPGYNKETINSFSKEMPFKYRLKRFLGIIKRVVQKKI